MFNARFSQAAAESGSAQSAQKAQPQAQTQPQAPAPQQPPKALSGSLAQSETGLESPWDARKILANVVKNNEQLKPVLAQMNPQRWYDQKGAPSTYILQWQTAQRQLNDVVIAANLLGQKTDSLPLALDAYFRLEALETTARSLDEGAREYGDRATADKLAQLIAYNFDARQRFREYLEDLSTSLEQNFKIADREAQRCRGIISKEPASSKRSKRN